MGKKATFMLDEQMMKLAKEYVEKGHFRSMNALVETAIKDELDAIRKDQIRKEIVQAGRDPMFLADIEEIEKDFQHSDFEEREK
jgi:Arc/MetJ-type ribon-helix-helix transcriptional regulator